MPSFSDIFSDDAANTQASTADPFVPNPGEGDPDSVDPKPEGGDADPEIASDSAFASDDFAA